MSDEITINNPLKIILKKNFNSKFELIKNYVTILIVSNNIKMTEFEINLLSGFIEEGEITPGSKRRVMEKLQSTNQTINNQLSKLKKLGLVSKENKLHKELQYNFTNPTLIYIKYGIIDQETRVDELRAVQGDSKRAETIS